MRHYRFYWMFGGHIEHAEDHYCAHDDGAREKAATVLFLATPSRCEAVEVWQGARYVMIIRREDIG
jgi:hypothetical protein